MGSSCSGKNTVGHTNVQQDKSNSDTEDYRWVGGGFEYTSDIITFYEYFRNFMEMTKFEELQKKIMSINFDNTSDHGNLGNREISQSIRKSFTHKLSTDDIDINYLENIINHHIYDTRHFSEDEEKRFKNYGYRIVRNDRIKVIKYNDEGFFEKHCDSGDGWKGIICIEASKKGGHLRLYHDNIQGALGTVLEMGLVNQDDDFVDLRYRENSFIIFNKNTPHEALKVIDGGKIIITFDIEHTHGNIKSDDRIKRTVILED